MKEITITKKENRKNKKHPNGMTYCNIQVILQKIIIKKHLQLLCFHKTCDSEWQVFSNITLEERNVIRTEHCNSYRQHFQIVERDSL